MLTSKEIESIAKHIEATKTSGQMVDETTFTVLKKYLTDRLIECIASPDARVRRGAVKVAGDFNSCSTDHQKRVLYRMATKIH